jgi:hypothetical protein
MISRFRSFLPQVSSSLIDRLDPVANQTSGILFGASEWPQICNYMLSTLDEIPAFRSARVVSILKSGNLPTRLEAVSQSEAAASSGASGWLIVNSFRVVDFQRYTSFPVVLSSRPRQDNSLRDSTFFCWISTTRQRMITTEDSRLSQQGQHFHVNSSIFHHHWTQLSPRELYWLLRSSQHASGCTRFDRDYVYRYGAV